MGALATRMVKCGLIDRVEGPGRAVRHRLTERGEDARRVGSALMDAVLQQSFGALSPEWVDQLHALLTLTEPGTTPEPENAP